MDAFQHDRGILAAPHPDETLDALLFQPDADRAAPRRVRLHHAGHVADGHRRAVLALEYDAFQVVGGFEISQAPHREFLVAVAQEAAADVHVRLGDRLLEVGQRQALREKARGVGLDMEFLQVAAEGNDVGDAGRLAQHAHHVPLHLRAQLVEVVPVAGDAELIHLPQRGRFRGEFRNRARRQRGGGDALQDDGARGKTRDVVREGERDQGKAEQAFASHQRHAGGAVQFPLQRHRDAPLDFLGRVAGQLRDDGDLRVGDVRVGLDRRLEVCMNTERGNHERGEERRNAAMNAGFDQELQHCARVSAATAAARPAYPAAARRAPRCALPRSGP